MNKERVGYLSTREQDAEVTASPRVILIDEKGYFPLVPYKSTPWLGLPGGRVESEEYQTEGNLLSMSAFPTLAREVREECGIDISHNLLERSACLGLTEVSSVSVSKGERRIKHSLVPIFLCLLPSSAFSGLREEVVLVNINSHLPGPLFPDARIAIEYLRRSRGEKSGPIVPEFLGPEKPVWVQMGPDVRLLFGRPI